MASLSLLTEVRQRTAALRTGLDCTPVVAAGADELGPKLRDCRSTAGGTSTNRPNGHTGKTTPKIDSKETKVRPQRSVPTVKPNVSQAPVTPVDPAQKEPGVVPELPPIGVLPTTSETPTTDAVPPEGNLGGLLGIFNE